MNFSEAMFYENYLTSNFHTKHCYFKTCLPTRQNGVENRDKAYPGVWGSIPTEVTDFFFTSRGPQFLKALLHWAICLGTSLAISLRHCDRIYTNRCLV